MLLLAVALARPSPEQINQFKNLYTSRMEKWLSGKPEQEQMCWKGVSALISLC